MPTTLPTHTITDEIHETLLKAFQDHPQGPIKAEDLDREHGFEVPAPLTFAFRLKNGRVAIANPRGGYVVDGDVYESTNLIYAATRAIGNRNRIAVDGSTRPRYEVPEFILDALSDSSMGVYSAADVDASQGAEDFGPNAKALFLRNGNVLVGTAGAGVTVFAEMDRESYEEAQAGLATSTGSQRPRC